MSVEHLDINPEEIDKVLGPLGAKAKKDNDDDIVRSINGIDARVDNVLYGAAAYAQQMLDEKVKLQEQKAERERQRQEIINRHDAFKAAMTGSSSTPAPPADPEPSVLPAPAAVESDPVIPPPAIVQEPVPVVVDVDEDFLTQVYSVDMLQGMSNERLQLLAETYGMDAEVTTANRAIVIGRIAAAQRRWCVENDVPDPNELNETRTTRVTVLERVSQSQHNPRNWSSWVQWLCAIVLGLIALRIGIQTNNWPGYIENSAPEMFFEFFWVVLVTAFGFFAGGWIGSLIDAQLNRSRTSNVEED